MAYLTQRRKRGKEDPIRFRERRGIPSATRPQGPLVWIHAASVGEATAVLALIERLLADAARPRDPGHDRHGHLGAPARRAGCRRARGTNSFRSTCRSWIARFLDHWRPDLALWVESELWPNLVLATHARGIPMVLVNARLSARSYSRWRRWPGLIGPDAGRFRPVPRAGRGAGRAISPAGRPASGRRRRSQSRGSPHCRSTAPNCRSCAARSVRVRSGSPPARTPARRRSPRASIAISPREHPGLLTIIVPRHPARGDAIGAMLAAAGAARRPARSRRSGHRATRDVYLADTMGELGLFYRLAGIAFVGGSLVAKGGHNPFEAARLDCAVLHGPDMSNCAAMAAALAAARRRRNRERRRGARASGIGAARRSAAASRARCRRCPRRRGRSRRSRCGAGAARALARPARAGAEISRRRPVRCEPDAHRP